LILLTGLAAPLAALLIVIDPDFWVGAAGYLAALAAAVLADQVSSPSVRSVAIAYEAPDKLFMADQGVLEFQLAFPNGNRSLPVEALVDADDCLEDIPAMEIALDDDSQGALAFPLIPKRRGEMRINRLWLRWRGPLGLITKVRRDELDIVCQAIPNLPAVKRAAIQLARRAAVHGVKPQMAAGDGLEFDALREHQPGMDTRGIDWKQSARHRKLLCKEFKAERNHNIILALDTGQLMREPIEGAPKLDHAINAGLVLAYQALSEGDIVSVYGFDRKPGGLMRAHGGPRSFPQVLEAMNRLDYAADETNYTHGLGALMAGLRQRSIIVVMTDILDTVSAELMIRNLERMAREHVLVFVALREPWMEAAVRRRPETVQDMAEIVVTMELDDERATVLKRLSRLGIDPIDVAPHELSTALLNRYLKVKQRAMVELA
jgi:uncharacterized protein (DUF58 family)